jgi:hypothetical protein
MTVSSAPLIYASIASRLTTTMAMLPRRILIRGIGFLAEGEVRRFLRLGLGICKLNSVQYD